MTTPPRIAVIVPCYKVRDHVLGVLSAIGPECSRIQVIDDCCPDRSGDFVLRSCRDPRLTVIHDGSNMGVGGADRGRRSRLHQGQPLLGHGEGPIHALASSLRQCGAFVHDQALVRMRNPWKRIFYSYSLRDMSLASVESPLGLAMLLFGVTFGGYHWMRSIGTNQVSTAGTVMLSALPVITGLQRILAFLGHDISSVPRRPLQRAGRLRA